VKTPTGEKNEENSVYDLNYLTLSSADPTQVSSADKQAWKEALNGNCVNGPNKDTDNCCRQEYVNECHAMNPLTCTCASRVREYDKF
jgi:hypothetical protein